MERFASRRKLYQSTKKNERVIYGGSMNKEEFLKLIETAKLDKNKNLYIESEYGRVYFATILTVCSDFVKEYCYKEDDGFEHYNRHFTSNDDTLEIKIVNNKQKVEVSDVKD